MSIIIRLQNLPWSANALDIRQFFSGLQIPEGGVHIVGGELGDAFIAFSTDEDARQAFLRHDGKIKSVQIKLMLSSRTEMQRVIEQARTQSMAAFMLPASTPQASAPLPAAVPPVIPAAVPEIKRDSKEKEPEKRKDRRRSRTRSKSRDRRDRSRDRKDRRHRDRSRSRSRDRRDRRRRDRSKSRNRSRDRETRRKDRVRSPKRDDKEDNSPFQRESRKSLPEVWANRTPQTLNIIPPTAVNEAPGLLAAFPLMDPTKRSLVNNIGGNLPAQASNGFAANNQMRDQGFGIENQQNLTSRHRESWPPANVVPAGAVPVAVTAAQRRSILDSFQAPQNSNNRGPREDLRRDFNFREKEQPKVSAQFENRNEHNAKRSRFDDDSSPPIDSCISMEPFYGSYGDLRRFFNRLSINYRGIKVINDEVGHKTGTCFVQFRNTSFKNDALKMNGLRLNNVTVKIKHISDKMFEEAIDRYNPRMDDGAGTEDQFGRTRPPAKPYKNPVALENTMKDFVCLKVVDLPTFVKEQDILHIFSQHPLISLHLDFKPKGGTVAYVKFSSKEVARLAIDEKSHHIINGKPVTVKPCKDEEFNKVTKEQNDALEKEKPKDIGTDCLSISKLPLKTNDRDISDFFSDIGVIPTKIHLMSNNLGFTGQAYCEFETKEEATRASVKNNTALGQNNIAVVPITRSEMEGILGSSLPHPGIEPGLPLPPGTPLPPIKSETSIKIELVAKQDAFPKREPPADAKSDVAERIEEAPTKLAVSTVSPTIEPHKSPQIPPLIRPTRSELIRDHDNPENVNVPHGGPGNIETMGGPRGGFDNLDNFNGPRGGPDNQENFNGPRGGRDKQENFNGPRGGRDNQENFNGPRGGRDNQENFNGPRGGRDIQENFNGPRGGPDMRDKLNELRGGPPDFRGENFGPRDLRDLNFVGPPHGGPDQRDNFNGPRGGHKGSSRFGSRLGSRFSDEGPQFNLRMDEGNRFGPRGGNGPRLNSRRDEDIGFNPHMDDVLLEDVPGCTVFMDNVPYKAGTNEILDFFDGYNCTNNVSRRYNANNTPSPEAKVTFYSAEDAFRAVRELHGAKIWGRAIYLRQV